MRSIRSQLIVGLVLGTVLLEFAAGAGLFAYVEEALEHSLDAALSAKADAIAAAVQMEDDGQPHLQDPIADVANSDRHQGDFYFQIWQNDGRVLAQFLPRDASGGTPLTLPNPRRRFGDVHLANGSELRAAQIDFYAKPDEDAFDAGHPQPIPRGQRLHVVVAHDRRAIDQTLGILLSGLVLMAIVMTLGIVGIVTWSVRRGLAPLRSLTQQLEGIGPSTLDARFPAVGLPAEIGPVAVKLNDLMQRIEDAFARERRFSADMAHELRTPLAELRSACEVALKWPESKALGEAVSDALAVAKQMEETVNSLLALVRIQSAIESAHKESVDVAVLIKGVWSQFEQSAVQKGLTVEQAIGPDSVASTDRRLLTQVLRNLLSNAVQHTPDGGHVAVETIAGGERMIVRIRNTNDSLKSSDIPYLCEPFWRKDSARTDRSSTGLGLAIASEYCKAIGASLELKLLPANWFEASIGLPVSGDFQKLTVREVQGEAVKA